MFGKLHLKYIIQKIYTVKISSFNERRITQKILRKIRVK